MSTLTHLIFPIGLCNPLSIFIPCDFWLWYSFHATWKSGQTRHWPLNGFWFLRNNWSCYKKKKHFNVSIKILFAFFKYIFTFSFCQEIRMLDRQHWNILFLSYWRFSTTSHVRPMVENRYSNLCFPSLSIVLFNIHGKVFYILISHFQCFYNFKVISQACNK